MVHQTSKFRILNSNSEFRISKKKLWMEILFLEMPHQGPCRGGTRDPKLEQFKQ